MMLVREAVRKFNVIIATCVGSGHEMFDDIIFERVIIDECAQSIGASSLTCCLLKHIDLSLWYSHFVGLLLAWEVVPVSYSLCFFAVALYP